MDSFKTTIKKVDDWYIKHVEKHIASDFGMILVFAITLYTLNARLGEERHLTNFEKE